MRETTFSWKRWLYLCACAGLIVFLAGCAGRQLSTAVQDQTLVPGPPPPEPVVEAPEPEPEPIEEARVEPEPFAPPEPEPEPEPPEEVPPPPEPEPIEEAAVPEPEPEPAPVVPEPEPEPEPIEEAAAPEPEPEPEPVVPEPEPEPIEEAAAPEPEPEPEPAPVVPEPEPEPEPLALGDVYFDYDQAVVRADAMSVLEDNARQLQAHNGTSLLIEGHCDERGTVEYNLVLGEKRARAVKEYLVDLGVPAQQIRITSFGKEKPFCTEHSVDCWQTNRRAHFVVQ